MGAVYAICGEYEIPNRKGKGFSLLRAVEDGITRARVVRWDKQFFDYVNRCPQRQPVRRRDREAHRLR